MLKPVTSTVIFILGIYTVVWGLWVANPVWTVFTQASLYEELMQFAPLLPPEVFWGLLAIICGALTIWGARHRSYRAVSMGALVAGWHWLMIAIFYFWGDWQNTGGITSLVFAIMAAYVWLNIKINHKDRGVDMEDLLPRDC